jgi:hypothetical protein
VSSGLFREPKRQLGVSEEKRLKRRASHWTR